MCRRSPATLFSMFFFSLALSPCDTSTIAARFAVLMADDTRSVFFFCRRRDGFFGFCVLSQPPRSPSVCLSSPCAAINILGLTWQLKSSDGPVLNNGLGAGLPVNSDVATLPSGGRGMNWRSTQPHKTPKSKFYARRGI